MEHSPSGVTAGSLRRPERSRARAAASFSQRSRLTDRAGRHDDWLPSHAIRSPRARQSSLRSTSSQPNNARLVEAIHHLRRELDSTPQARIANVSYHADSGDDRRQRHALRMAWGSPARRHPQRSQRAEMRVRGKRGCHGRGIVSLRVCHRADHAKISTNKAQSHAHAVVGSETNT